MSATTDRVPGYPPPADTQPPPRSTHARYVLAQARRWATTGRLIHPDTAREIARRWAGNPSAPLWAFGYRDTIGPGLRADIATERRYPGSYPGNDTLLDALGAYVDACPQPQE